MKKLYYSIYNSKTKYELVFNNTYSSDLLCYTNGSHKVVVKFCVDEVSEERGVTDVRRIKRGKSSRLRMPKAPQVNISKDTQASKLGDAPVGIPSFFFNKYRYTSVFVLFTLFVPFVFFFFFKNRASMR